MRKEVVAVTLVSALLITAAVLTAIELTIPVKANAIPLPERLPVNQAYIRSNGDIDPPTLPIHRSGSTYVLDEEISNYSIAVETDGVVLDGNGFSLTIPAYGEQGKTGQVKSVPALIQIENHTDVIIKNFKLFHSAVAISVSYSSYITIADNNITQCSMIFMRSCSYCSIIRNILDGNGIYGYDMNYVDIRYNKISNSGDAIYGEICNSSIIGNVIVGNNDGLLCWSFNRIIGNSFENNEVGILSNYDSNVIHHNNFINNSSPLVVDAPTKLYENKEGNYWSGYTGNDADGDGIGGSPVVIPSIWKKDNYSNIDRFPLKLPYALESEPLIVEVISPKNQTYPSGNIQLVFSVSGTRTHKAYSLDGNDLVPISMNINLTMLPQGTHSLTVQAEDVFGNEGSETIVFYVDLRASEKFILTLVVAVTLPVVVVAGLLVYFKKRKHEAGQA